MMASLKDLTAEEQKDLRSKANRCRKMKADEGSICDFFWGSVYSRLMPSLRKPRLG